MSQLSARELDLIIKEMERLNDCYIRLNDVVHNRIDEKCQILDQKVENKVDKSTEKWKYMLIFGSYAFTLFLLGWVLAIHLTTP